MIKTDVLVLGSGLSGCIAALSAADRGVQVTLISKSKSIVSGNTPWAQGGIIYKGINDSPEKLKDDIINAGDHTSWDVAVEQLCNYGPGLIEKFLFERCKVDFDRNDSGEVHLTAEGAHSEPRIIHSKDKTGLSIHEAVAREVDKHPNIKVITNHTAVDLLTLSHHSANPLDIYEKPACFGAYVIDNDECKVFPVLANETILALGGLGQIYLHTTNPAESTGDGIALAWRAGARCFNLQYIQFHPTTFYGEKDRFLISEAVRGEGGILIDNSGKPFMDSIHELGSLAPRDIVARAIHQTMLETEHPCVYLDISFKNSDWIKNRFPTIYKHCLQNGTDISIEPIPVVPSAHYSCGGVGVSLKGRTSLQRLYAVGEVSCTGVHGANRLASTSLLECIVWGQKAGEEAAEHVKVDDYFPELYPWDGYDEYMDPALIRQDWLTIRNTMWNYVGLVRTRQRLLRATTILRHLQSEVENFYQKARMTKEMIQLRNGVQTAIAVTSATLESRTSRGTHYIVS
ncbi:MAG: L-aspartate oxidase [Candidatus Kapabacteria bacterium]|nr:L-aspartate oxidase [Ignavibacteriota bacterium]MCW5884393.1 L-aspartate oxidase [Candidatus Kapabacteria bacterium]